MNTCIHSCVHIQKGIGYSRGHKHTHVYANMHKNIFTYMPYMHTCTKGLDIEITDTCVYMHTWECTHAEWDIGTLGDIQTLVYMHMVLHSNVIKYMCRFI